MIIIVLVQSLSEDVTQYRRSAQSVGVARDHQSERQIGTFVIFTVNKYVCRLWYGTPPAYRNSSARRKLKMKIRAGCGTPPWRTTFSSIMNRPPQVNSEYLLHYWHRFSSARPWNCHSLFVVFLHLKWSAGYRNHACVIVQQIYDKKIWSI